MAKNRMISTSFWNDGYTSNLDPIEKLLFIYLITNERSTLAGVYELPIKIMAVETGIETEMVKKILGRFEEDNKIKVLNGWVSIRNFSKHHPAGSPTVQKGIEDALSVAPEWAKGYIKGIDTLSPSASASASNGAEEPRVVFETEDSEKEEKVTKTRKNTPEMLAGYEIFDDQPARKTWKLMEIERESMKALLEGYGHEKLVKRYSAVKKHRGEQFCPLIKSPSTFLQLMPNLERFMKNLND